MGEGQGDVGPAADGLRAFGRRSCRVVEIDVQIGNVHDLQNFSLGRLLPLLIRPASHNSLDVVVKIPSFVLLGTHSQFMANRMRVGVVQPERVHNRLHHLADCAFADVVVLQMFFCAVLCPNQVQNLFTWPHWDGPLVFEKDVVAHHAGHVGYLQLSANNPHQHQQQQKST